MKHLINNKIRLNVEGACYNASGINNIIVRSEYPIERLIRGMVVTFIASETNTSAVTLQINDLPAKNIVFDTGSQLTSGTIVKGKAMSAIFDGTNFILSSSSLSYTKSESDTLFLRKDGPVVGLGDKKLNFRTTSVPIVNLKAKSDTPHVMNLMALPNHYDEVDGSKKIPTTLRAETKSETHGDINISKEGLIVSSNYSLELNVNNDDTGEGWLRVHTGSGKRRLLEVGLDGARIGQEGYEVYHKGNLVIQDGTTTQKGLVQLNDTVNSTSTTQAATANSVKTAFDKASNALDVANSKLSEGGNATSASKLQTPRNINGVAFDGTKDITITANPNAHNHDDRYFTEGEMNTKLDLKADKTYVDTKVAQLVNSAPETLDTLKELGDALGNDPNFATTVSNRLGLKAEKSVQVLAGAGLTGGGDLSANRTINIVSGNDSLNVSPDNVIVNTVNELNSNSTTKPLSAAMGKLINDSKLTKIALSGKCQTWSYRKTLIALCEVSTTDKTALNSFSSGNLILKRTNGLYGMYNLQISIENQYNTANFVNCTYVETPYHKNLVTTSIVKPCTFVYKNKMYAGVDLFLGDSEYGIVEFYGSTNFNIFAFDYDKTGSHGPEIGLDESKVKNTINYNNVKYIDGIAINGKTTCPFDIGDIFISKNSMNPSTKWTGTAWRKIENRMLMGCSNSENPGAIGGSSNITLSVANLPAHNHTLSGMSISTAGDHHHQSGNHRHQVDNHTHSFGTSNITGKINIGRGVEQTSASGAFTRIGRAQSWNGHGDWGIPDGNTTFVLNAANGWSGVSGGSAPLTDYQNPNTSNSGAHTHTITGGTISNTGSTSSFDILPPYIKVNIWERIG